MQPAAVAAMVMLMTFVITLNPDGSGKVAVEITCTPRELVGPPAAEQAVPPELVRTYTQRFLSLFPKAEAWSDVSGSATPEGLVAFKGTAYFKDSTTASGPIRATWTKDAKGDMVLSMTFDGYPNPSAPQPQVLTDAQLAAQVAAAQAEWLKVRAATELKQQKVKIACAIRLPGTVAETSLIKQADGSVLWEFNGAKAFKAEDELMNDANYIRESIRGGLLPRSDRRNLVYAEKIFGAKCPWTARVTGDLKPQFDYAAEVKAAQEAYPKMAEKLGLPAENEKK